MSQFLYTLTYIFALSITLIFLLVLSSDIKKSKIINYLKLLVISNLVWIIIDFSGSTLLVDSQLKSIFINISAFLVFYIFVFLFQFIYSVARKKTINLVVLLVLAIAFANTLLIVFTDQVIEGVGYNLDGYYVLQQGPYFQLYNFSLILILSLLSIVTIDLYFTATTKIAKKQLLICLGGLTAPSILGILTFLILPLFNINLLNITHLFLLSVTSVFMVATVKWKVFDINLSTFSIRSKINLTFLITYLVVSVVIGISVFQIFSYLFNNEAYSNLITSIKSKAVMTDHYVSHIKESGEEFSTDEPVIDNLRIYESTQDQSSKEELETILYNFKSLTPEIVAIHLFDSHQNIVASTHPSLNQRTINFLYSDKQTDLINSAQREFYFLSKHPVVDNGKLLGYLIIQSNAEDLVSFYKDREELGNTSDLYLIDKSGTLIYTDSQSLHLDQQFKIESPITSNCLSSRTVNESNITYESNIHPGVDVYSNHLNRKVIGTYAYLQSPEWCLISELSQQEATAPYRLLYRYLIVILILIFIAYLVISRWLSDKITNPLVTLTKGIRSIRKGYTDEHLVIKNKDEIGELARQFNKLTDKVKESQEEIQQRVEEQTESIKAQKKELEDQQTAILNILEDVEAEKEKKTNERDRINTILQSIGDGVFVVDNHLKITLCNEFMEELTGYTQEELVGSQYGDKLVFIYEEEKTINDKFIKDALRTKKKQSMDKPTILVRKDGSTLAVSDSASPIVSSEGEVIGCVVVFRDITKERELDKIKSEFVSVASHQLRTPLTSIKWYIELLLEEKNGNLNKMQREFVKRIYEGNERMINLVNDLLNVSRIDSGRKFSIVRKHEDIIHVIKNIVDELKVQAKERNIKIKFTKNVPDECTLFIDANKIGEVILNLMTNAIKYSKEGGTVTVDVVETNKKATLSVQDQGVGIPQSQQKYIFNKLFRADNVVRMHIKGTGLGLYIAKSIVEDHEGKIYFESKLNKGTTFFIELPKNKDKKDEKPPKHEF